MAFRIPSVRELTTEQQAVLDLPSNGRHLVTGPPGSGKTVLALLRAQRLIAERRQPTIILYHKALKAMVLGEAERLKIDRRVRSYHAWTDWVSYSLRGRPAPRRNKQPDWQDIGRWADQIYEARDRLMVSDLIVDEGQDLPQDFYQLMTALGINITVFADENQRLTDTQSTVAQIRFSLAGPTELQVPTHHRNTAQTAAVASHFYTGIGELPRAPTRVGLPVRLVRCRDLENFAQMVCTVSMNAPRREEMSVFTYHADTREKVAGLIRANALEASTRHIARHPDQRGIAQVRAAWLRKHVYTYDSENGELPPLSSPGLFVVCNASAKGLEFDATFVWLDDLATLDETTARMQAYVLASRPRHELYLAWRGAKEDRARNLPRWVADLPPGLVLEVAGAEWA